MKSLVFTNSSPALPAWGGKSKLMGVSPIACGAPAGKEKPFVLDMAPSVAARGKIYKAKRRGEKIPADWALDGDGAPTEDPAKALEGVMLPMGGPKGVCAFDHDGRLLRSVVWICFCGSCNESIQPFEAS